MSTAMLTRPELTEDMLRAAWSSLSAQRAHWPQDYQEAMGNPLYSRLVRIEAALRTRGPAGHPPRCEAAQRRPARPLTASHDHLVTFDRKRAAAGDRDD